MKVAFIGLGNMGASLAKAVAKKWTRKTCSWSIVLLKRCKSLYSQLGTASDLEQVFQGLKQSFRVKPYQICPLLEEYQGILDQRS